MSVQNGKVPPAVRTPDPLAGSRRRALERLGQGLRAMGLGAIGDIGSNAFETVSTLTWNAASDWDSAVSEAGVVHESYGDLPGADVVQLGYPSFDRGGSALWSYLTFDADSGTSITDHSGNGRGAIANGVTLGSTGGHNSTTGDLDGTDDNYTYEHGFGSDGSVTVGMWVNIDDWGGSTNKQLLHLDDGSEALEMREGDSGLEWFLYDGSNSLGIRDSNTTPATGSWECLMGVYDDSTGDWTLYINASSVGSANVDANLSTIDGTQGLIGDHADGFGEPADGRIEYFRIWTRALSSAEVQAYNDAGTFGYLETATKSFASSSTPDLQNLSYSLNGQAIDLKVIGSPGTGSEEIVTQTLDGSTSYALSWSSSHTDFRLRPEISTTDVTVSPTFSAGKLVG